MFPYKRKSKMENHELAIGYGQRNDGLPWELGLDLKAGSGTPNTSLSQYRVPSWLLLGSYPRELCSMDARAIRAAHALSFASHVDSEYFSFTTQAYRIATDKNSQ